MTEAQVAFPSVSEVLSMDVVKFALPKVVSGGAGLGRPVHWVHVGEICDIAKYLSGGELVLTTGVALPPDNPGLSHYVAALDDAGAAGLVVGLGHRFSYGDLPGSLRSTADKRQFPLFVLGRDTPFVRFSAAVNRHIVHAQVEALQASEVVHRTFGEMALEGASAEEIIRQAARMTKRPVVLESLTHRVLAFNAGPVDAELVLDDWERRSRMAQIADRTGFNETNKWLITTVGARGLDWGRLIVLTDAAPTSFDAMVLERTAAALALHRLMATESEPLEMQAHRSIIDDLLTHAHPTDEVARRARALGLPLRGRRLLGVAILHPHDETPLGNGLSSAPQAAAIVLQALTTTGVPGLAGSMGKNLTAVLLSITPRESENALMTRFSAVLRRDLKDPLIGVGSCVTDLADARRSLMEAERVAEAAGFSADDRPFHRLPDVRIRGLLHLLREDARLQTFTERELGELLAYDHRNRTRLLDALALYLDHGRNKSAAADASFMARSSFYDRLDKIEKVLHVDLQSVETCLSLHVAVMAHRLMAK
jgi:PucR family transcriptional regulator, purine catabolism regulatory protein